MAYLIIVSIVWALSFGLIKTHLANLDSSFVSFIRLFLSFIIFLPFLKIKGIPKKLMAFFIILGMIQFGLMYITYLSAYQYLKAYQIALFTIFTPIYVTLISDLTNKKINTVAFISALLAILGTGIIIYKEISLHDFGLGFVLMQLSNFSFAFGQVFYKKIMAKYHHLKDKNVFALLYLGAVIISGFNLMVQNNITLPTLNLTQISVFLYLGFVASGLCFFLWNKGATQTKTGTLAVFNNIKIPLAILFAVLFFGESVNNFKLFLGFLLIGTGILINEYKIKKNNPRA